VATAPSADPYTAISGSATSRAPNGTHAAPMIRLVIRSARYVLTAVAPESFAAATAHRLTRNGMAVSTSGKADAASLAASRPLSQRGTITRGSPGRTSTGVLRSPDETKTACKAAAQPTMPNGIAAHTVAAMARPADADRTAHAVSRRVASSPPAGIHAGITHQSSRPPSSRWQASQPRDRTARARRRSSGYSVSRIPPAAAALSTFTG